MIKKYKAAQNALMKNLVFNQVNQEEGGKEAQAPQSQFSQLNTEMQGQDQVNRMQPQEAEGPRVKAL